MEYLDLNMAMATKFKRRMPEMTQDEFNEYLRLHSQAKFDIIKMEATIVKILRQMHA